MNRRQLMCRMATLAGSAIVSPSVSLAALWKNLPDVAQIVPNEDHDKINVYIGVDLLAHVVSSRGRGEPLFNAIIKTRKLLASNGWSLPIVRIQDYARLPSGDYAIHVYGTRVLTDVVLPDIAKKPFQQRPEEDTEQEQIIATQLASIAVQYQHLWPRE